MSTATKDYKRLHGLTIEQENAIDLLTAGKTDREIAEAVDVHRVTVTKWRLYDPYFKAALNGRRREILGASTERLRSMVPKLLGVIEQQLDERQLEAETAKKVSH